jgi:transcriptional regulator with XRE-family HTH domain
LFFPKPDEPPKNDLVHVPLRPAFGFGELLELDIKFPLYFNTKPDRSARHDYTKVTPRLANARTFLRFVFDVAIAMRLTVTRAMVKSIRISGKKLAQMREERHLTQDELAQRIGATRGAVGHWELEDVARVLPRLFRRITEELKVEPATLIVDGNVEIGRAPEAPKLDRPALKKLVRAVEKSGDREAAWDLVYEAIYAVGRMEGATVGEVVGALKEGLREARRGPQPPDDGTGTRGGTRDANDYASGPLDYRLNKEGGEQPPPPPKKPKGKGK